MFKPRRLGETISRLGIVGRKLQDALIDREGRGTALSVDMRQFLQHSDGLIGLAKEYKGLTVPYVLGAQDLNGDGKADLAMADITTYDVQLFPSSGDTFGTPKVIKAGSSPDALALGLVFSTTLIRVANMPLFRNR